MMFSYRMNNIVPIIYLQFIMVFVQSTKNGWDDQCGEFWWRNCYFFQSFICNSITISVFGTVSKILTDSTKVYNFSSSVILLLYQTLTLV